MDGVDLNPLGGLMEEHAKEKRSVKGSCTSQTREHKDVDRVLLFATREEPAHYEPSD